MVSLKQPRYTYELTVWPGVGTDRLADEETEVVVWLEVNGCEVELELEDPEVRLEVIPVEMLEPDDPDVTLELDPEITPELDAVVTLELSGPSEELELDVIELRLALELDAGVTLEPSDPEVKLELDDDAALALEDAELELELDDPKVMLEVNEPELMLEIDDLERVVMV